MSLHGLGVIGAQVAASIKSNDDKHIATSQTHSPPLSIQSTPRIEIERVRSLDFDPSIGAKPYSPFYSHGTPTISYEHLTFESKNASRNGSGLRDLENAGPYTFRNESPRRSKLWEGNVKPRSCLHSLSSRQRMIFKAIIAIVTVGTMIAIALGITYAVGGAVWKSSAEQTSLG
ncbi:hypothetical protein N7466_007683 [Penicillium verhagenii]|uniref:uncharacterized protein n=1 Tax=Penicillium verhagenii TaxID=1562060 RepID=UPI0025450B87|nr:uncharacterized protein N7466_007683 [Penicillium verhagenii]KAJ5928727.1 hypothetical protein N7466_007683 [Penicillium verhagenii]